MLDSWAELVLPAIIRVVPLGKRVDRSLFLLDVPGQAAVDYWRRKAGQSRVRKAPAVEGQPSAGVRAMLALPRKCPRLDGAPIAVPRQLGSRPTTLDPLRLVNAVAVTTHIRWQETFSDAVQDFKMYEDDDFTGEVARDASRDPGKSCLFRSQRRMDMTGMLIQRRIWHQEVLDDEVVAVNAYSDSSPVVGMELQGMLCDVCKKDGSVRQVTMPGGSVYYGIQDAIAKMMVFLWSAWSVFGPELPHMKYFCDHLLCWTTDFGVEAKSIEIPDCLDAFLAWVAGRALEDCVFLVKFGQRLFRRALRIVGWNHTLGNIMSRVAKSYLWWPEVLGHLRNLCRLFQEWFVEGVVG